DIRLVPIFQGYAKNAYPWLSSRHASGVRTMDKLESRAKARDCIHDGNAFPELSAALNGEWPPFSRSVEREKRGRDYSPPRLSPPYPVWGGRSVFERYDRGT